MMDALLSPLDLPRFRFASVVVWHFLFPAFAIGLANFLVGLEAVVLGKAVHLRRGLWLLTESFHHLTCWSEQQFQPAESHQRHLRLVASLSETRASRTYYF